MASGINLGFFNRPKELNRPVLKPEWGPADWLLEAIALIMLAITIGFLAYTYPKLPATIPTHFNGSGQPDEMGNKLTVLVLPGISLFMYLILTGINLFPHTFNFPGKITPQNAMRQYTLATRLVRYLKAIVITLFFSICYFTTQVALNKATGLGLWFMPVFLAMVFVPIIIYMILATRTDKSAR
jgi:uncharacterized membrane protein